LVSVYAVSLVLGPACNDYNKLTTELEVERACRTEAEKIATNVRLVRSLSLSLSLSLSPCLSAHLSYNLSVCIYVSNKYDGILIFILRTQAQHVMQ